MQTVNTPAMTIVNTTRPGHAFYPGSVTMQVSPQGSGSLIQITGTGTGPNPYLNDLVGYLYFGLISYLTQTGCDLATGTPGAGNGNYYYSGSPSRDVTAKNIRRSMFGWDQLREMTYG